MALLIVRCHDRFIVPAAIKDTADLNITAGQHLVCDDRASLEPEYPQTGSQVIAGTTALRKCQKTCASRPDATDIADSGIRIAAATRDER
jgi:hypothetical protein